MPNFLKIGVVLNYYARMGNCNDYEGNTRMTEKEMEEGEKGGQRGEEGLCSQIFRSRTAPGTPFPYVQLQYNQSLQLSLNILVPV